MRRQVVLATVACVLGTVLAVSGAFAWIGAGSDDDPAAPPARIDPAALATADDLDGIVAALQERLRDEPADAGS